ncbi:carbamoyl-phosphate synthase large subunit protein [Marine Group I thaumarchaeote SCGC AAA799-B03]|uniref:Carbamoyl-phosphate synthase large subunit protein n=1 Tax=Marine Group I thaumarchaeote SCGC AAA799-B03 TaxID=1502289 RepID=A0A087S922_9ARCH|nr:carbamoyl-phosphate synthase large subunit protein [Marine Group I thaumarchaeote SCGC AAA799-B03]
MPRVLITGAGGAPGVNFTRAAKLNPELYLIGSDQNQFHTIYLKTHKKTIVPSPDSPSYIESLNKIISSEDISFIHPQPTPELQVIAENREKLDAKTFLPETEAILKDKLQQQESLRNHNVPVAKTVLISDLDNLDKLEDTFSYPIWIRARKGVAGRLSNKCNNVQEVLLWIKLCLLQKRAEKNEFLAQEYFSGRDIAWDSLWYHGKLLVSYCRERLEYPSPFSKLTMSGIAGTPSVAKIIHDKRINDLGVKAVKAISKIPHGCFSVDIKEDGNGNPHITEVDSGKFHTTIGLWGYMAENNLKLPWYYNLPRLYLHLGLGGEPPIENHFDIYPNDLYLMRNMDCGAWIRLKEKEEQII